MTQGLTNAESFEILVIITPKETMGVQVYPHVNGGYINVDKASDSEGLKSKLLNYNDSHFLYWGMDDEHDIFAMFNFTLESGFPLESFEIVLRSIENLDEYVGELKDLAGM